MSQRHLSGILTEHRKFESYNSLKDQLQAENQILMQERSRLQQQLNTGSHLQSFNTIVQRNDHPQGQKQKRRKKSRVDTIIAKIRDVIQYCSREKDDRQGKDSESYQQVIEAEQQVLNYLDNIKHKKTTSFPEPFSRPGSSHIPLRHISKFKDDSESEIEIIREKSRLREGFQGGKFEMSDNAMVMIDQIEKKALIQIQKLRNDKIKLFKIVNEQIRSQNDDKRKIIQLEKQIAFLQSQMKKIGLLQPIESQQYIPNHPLEQIHEDELEDQKIHYFEKRPSSPNHFPHFPIKKQNIPNSTLGRINYGPYEKSPFENRKNVVRPKSPPEHHHVKSEKNLQYEVSRLEQENKKIKESLIKPPQNISADKIKNRLHEELIGLKHKINHYEQVISSSERKNGNSTTRQRAHSQIEYLLEEGNKIGIVGERLMRIKSKPELRATMDNVLTISKKQEIKREVNFLKKRIQTLKDDNERMIRQHESKSKEKFNKFEFTSVPKQYNHKEREMRFYSPKVKFSQPFKNFQPNKYENLIREMKTAVRK